jgi:hypothetical protein
MLNASWLRRSRSTFSCVGSGRSRRRWPWFSRLRAGAPRLWSRESERGQRPKGRLLRHLRLHLVRCWCPRGPGPDTAPRSACSRALPPRPDAREPRASFVRATDATASLALGSSSLPSPWPLLSRPLYFRAAVWARASTPSAAWAGAAPCRQRTSTDPARGPGGARWVSAPLMRSPARQSSLVSAPRRAPLMPAPASQAATISTTVGGSGGSRSPCCAAGARRAGRAR